MGRLVQTHSTNIDGLVKWLKKLAINKNIQTITPGVIGRSKGRIEVLKIRVSRKTNEGYKLIARKGASVQEIYIVTKLEKQNLISEIHKSNPYS